LDNRWIVVYFTFDCYTNFSIFSKFTRPLIRHNQSFSKSDSTYKLKIGGKGVGRFTYLKVFDNVKITSIFNDGNILKKREFSFTLDDIKWDGNLFNDGKQSIRQTVVKLNGMKAEYQKNCPKNADTIARRIIEHFLTHFSIMRVPKIELIDEYDDCVFDLNDEFEKNIKINFAREQITVDGRKLKLGHFYLRVGTGDAQHNIHLCAHNRSIEEYPLKRQNCIFESRLFYNNHPFIYSCCVSGDFLDKRSDDSRTKLNLVDYQYDLRAADEPSRETILAEICKCIEKQLSEHLAPIKENNFSRVQEFIQKNPRYRPLLGARKEQLEHIRSGLKVEELDIELFKLLKKFEAENFQEGQRLKQPQKGKTTEASLADHKRKFDKYLEETNEIGFSKLAEYVIHRRAVIDFIKECKKLTPQGTYEYESAIHNVIFPMRKTSDTIETTDQSNLWLLDDRLAYHYHLSSDMTAAQSGKFDVENSSKDDRIDLVILQTFDRPHAFVESFSQPFNSVTIVEFKRPMRDDYSSTDEKRNPIQQVWNYVKSIQNGQGNKNFRCRCQVPFD
ncbi:MAG: hypothetical protein ACRC2T_01185, partial [Thermoguttaceae bacterium]